VLRREIQNGQIVAQVVGGLPQEEHCTIQGCAMEQELRLVTLSSQRKCYGKRFIDPKEGNLVLTSGSLSHGKEKVEAHTLAQ
jgi:hypothetical protein